MHKIWKYPRDMIQYIRSSSCINLFSINIFFKRSSIFKRNYAGTFDVPCGMFCNVIINNVISFVLRDGDTDSENLSLIRHSVSDGQKTCSSEGVSLIGIRYRDQTWISRPRFNISLGTWQTLMYWKIMFDRCYCISSTISLSKFGKLYGTIFCHRLAVSKRVHIFLNIRLPDPSASRDSKWLPSFDLTWIFRK